MSGALRVYVRGFESQANGEKIVAALERMGFDIKDAFDGDSDTLGGLIETGITPYDNLDFGDSEVVGQIDKVEALIHQVVPTAFVQYDIWEEIGGDHGSPGYEGRYGCCAMRAVVEEEGQPQFTIVDSDDEEEEDDGDDDLSVVEVDEFIVRGEKAKIVTVAPKSMVFRFLQHHCEDGEYSVEGPNTSCTIIRKDGKLYPSSGVLLGVEINARSLDECRKVFGEDV